MQLQREDNRVHLAIIAQTSLATTIDDTISTATNITLNTDTEIIEVTAVNGSVYIKFSATASAATSDSFIPEGSTRHYGVKKASITTISVIEGSSGAGVRIYEY